MKKYFDQKEPKPRMEIRPEPSKEQIEEWLNEGGCEATDGCWVDPDGRCQHGCSSWLIVLGMI
jgi:hypothetical protein